MAAFEAGSWVWIPDEEQMHVPAKVLGAFKAGEPGAVRTEDGEDVSLTPEQSKECTVANAECLNSKIDNLINLNDLTENAILHNLRIRFKESIIYTNVSSILISVNPFKMLPLYTPEIMEKYRTNARNEEPHVFQVADEAYRNMLSDRADQSIIISGESGAGKTEAMKICLTYLGELSSAKGGKPSLGKALV